jgi:hypothetical protein
MEATSKRKASKSASLSTSIYIFPQPDADVELMFLIPRTLENAPSSTDVISCSITLPFAPCHPKLIVMPGSTPEGFSFIGNNGAIAKPEMIRTMKISIILKGDLFINNEELRMKELGSYGLSHFMHLLAFNDSLLFTVIPEYYPICQRNKK